jgi:hypothetical protein
MVGNRGAKRKRQTAAKTAKRPRPAGKKNRPNEELGPERRTELARQAEAKEYRGKPPSI